jgi:hypothetical protein
MYRNELFSGLARASMHASGELLYGMPNEERVVTQNAPQLEHPAEEPVRQVQKPARELDVDIHGWLKRRDHVLGY